MIWNLWVQGIKKYAAVTWIVMNVELCSWLLKSASFWRDDA